MKYTEEAIEACETTGINIKDLYPKSFEDFKLAGVSEEVARTRFEYYDNK
jgi:hypothetical protein